MPTPPGERVLGILLKKPRKNRYLEWQQAAGRRKKKNLPLLHPFSTSSPRGAQKRRAGNWASNRARPAPQSRAEAGGEGGVAGGEGREVTWAAGSGLNSL